MIELLRKPIYRLGLLMGLKSGTTDTAEAVEVTGGTLHDLTHSLDSTTGLPVADKSTGWAKHVMTGPASASHTRNIAAANSTYARATNNASWAVGSHISLIKITPIIAAGAAANIGDILGYAVINGPSEAYCAAAFADAGSPTADVQYVPIIRGIPCEIHTVLGADFSGEITQVDISPITTGRFIVEAN